MICQILENFIAVGTGHVDNLIKLWFPIDIGKVCHLVETACFYPGNNLANSYVFANWIIIKFLQIIPFRNYNIATLPNKRMYFYIEFHRKNKQAKKNTKMYDYNKTRYYFHSLRVYFCVVFPQVKHFRALQEQANTYLDLLCSMCDLSDTTVKSTAADIQQTKQTVQDNHNNPFLILFRALTALICSLLKRSYWVMV